MRTFAKMIYKHNCLHFKGHIPCDPHKENGYHCDGCPAFVEIEKKILIIKLGAIGDVIQTTPLVTKYKELFPHAKFTWITLSPAILPKNEIHEILPLSIETVMYVENTKWDIAINLDKEKEASALMAKIESTEKYGFTLKDGATVPIDAKAEHKYYTGLFDDVSKANTLNYCTEIFDICDLTYSGEKYLLDNHSDKGFSWPEIDSSKTVIGLNTGCGPRWTTRLWSIENWANLAKILIAKGYQVVLLGGEQEDERNTSIAALSNAQYFGYFSLAKFINLIDQMTLVVTQVTMGMHLTLGLQKKIVLMNTIFNPHEFDLFNNGELIGPAKECKCFYRGSCIDGESCMSTIESAGISDAVDRVLAI